MEKPKINYLPGGYSDSDDSDGDFDWNTSSTYSTQKSKTVSPSHHHQTYLDLKTEKQGHSSSFHSTPSPTSITSKGRTKVKTKKPSLPSIPYVNVEQAVQIASELNNVWHATANPGKLLSYLSFSQVYIGSFNF